MDLAIDNLQKLICHKTQPTILIREILILQYNIECLLIKNDCWPLENIGYWKINTAIKYEVFIFLKWFWATWIYWLLKILILQLSIKWFLD